MEKAIMIDLIKIVSLFILPILFAITNRWRGLGEDRPRIFTTKTMIYGLETIILFSFLILVYAQNVILISMGYFLTRWLCSSFGWGKYFPHIEQNYKEKEFIVVDWIMAQIMPWDRFRASAWVKNWKTIAMTLRFVLTFGLIQVPIMAYLTKSWIILLFGLFIYSICGVAYRFAFDHFPRSNLDTAEHITGGLIGLFLSSIVWLS